jgi:hypothetical protein
MHESAAQFLEGGPDKPPQPLTSRLAKIYYPGASDQVFFLSSYLVLPKIQLKLGSSSGCKVEASRHCRFGTGVVCLQPSFSYVLD